MEAWSTLFGNLLEDMGWPILTLSTLMEACASFEVTEERHLSFRVSLTDDGQRSKDTFGIVPIGSITDVVDDLPARLLHSGTL
jgi:hypothetical protein